MKKIIRNHSCKLVLHKIRVNSRIGLIQVYTGDGKGKTTAAVGQAIRASGQGLRVCFIQFFKDRKLFSSGEKKILDSLPEIDFYRFATQHPLFYRKISCARVKNNVRKGLSFLERIFAGKKYDLLVLDEIIIALRDKFITPGQLVRILRKKPKKMEIILTGRGAPQELLDFADLVTEMKKIKHPYDRGVKARKGIEY